MSVSETLNNRNQSGLLISLIIGFVVLALSLVLYDVLRRLLPAVYYWRNVYAGYTEVAADDEGRPLPSEPMPPRWPLSPIWRAMHMSSSEIQEKFGLDAVMHLRFLRNRCRIFCILFFFTSIVLFPIYAQGPNRRLPDDDPKQVVGILVVSLSNLADDDFRLWFTLVADMLILGMLLLFMYRDMSTFVAKRRVYRAQSMPANYTLLVRDMPMEMASSPTAVRAYWERFFPDTVAAVIIVRDDALYTSIKRRYVAAITRREVAEWRWVHKADRAPDARPQYKYRGSVATRVDAIAYWRAEAARLAALLVELQGSVGAASLAPPTRAAFVVFHERRSAALAAQAYLGHVASQHVVSHAPEPAAVNWPKLARVAWRSPIRKILSLVFVTFLCGVWALIVAAIRSLSDLQAIAQQLAKNSAFEWLEDLVNANEKLTTLLQGTLPPLLLFIVLKLIPVFIRLFVAQERIHARHLVEAKIQNYYTIFLIVATFFTVVISGSIVSQLPEFIENPSNVLTLLAKTVPQQGVFLSNYVLVNAFLGFSILLWNPARLFVRGWLKMFAKTPRQHRNANAIFGWYPYFKLYPISTIIALLAIVYSTLLPLISLFAVIFFGIAYVVAQVSIVYQFTPLFESGGYTYRGAWNGLLYAILLKQFVMTGVFSLFTAKYQAIIEGCSILITLYFTYWCMVRFRGIAKHGSLIETLDTASAAGGCYTSTTPSVAASPPGAFPESSMSRPVLRARVGPPPPPIIYPSISLSPPPDPEVNPSADALPQHFIGLYVPPGFRPLEPVTNLSGVDVHPREDPADDATTAAVAEAVALAAAKDTKALAKRHYSYVWKGAGVGEEYDEARSRVDEAVPDAVFFGKEAGGQPLAASSSSEEPRGGENDAGGLA